MTVPDPDHASGVIQFRAQFVSRQAQYWAPFAIYLRIWVLPIPYVGAVAQNALRLWGGVFPRVGGAASCGGQEFPRIGGARSQGKNVVHGLRSEKPRENGWRVLLFRS